MTSVGLRFSIVEKAHLAFTLTSCCNQHVNDHTAFFNNFL